MTTKYKFQEIRSQILLDLRPAYPTRLFDYKTSSCRGEVVFGSPLPHPNSVLDLFVQCKVSFALPFACYRACAAGDPLTTKAALSPSILKVAIRGQARLKMAELRLAKELAFQDCKGWQCSGKTPASRAQVFNWIHPEVATQGGILEREDFAEPGFCSQCLQTFTVWLSGSKESIWENLPLYFGLPPWKEAAYQNP